MAIEYHPEVASVYSKFAAFAVLAVALALPLALSAQPTAPELKVGSVRSSDSRDPLTDGGIRTLRTQPYSIPLSLAREYRIAPNDLLEIDVMDADNLRRTVRVNSAGAVTLPLIGPVGLAGMTPQEAEAYVARRYAEKYLQDPQVSVFVREFTAERMTVEGAVVRPGIFPMAGSMTLLRALAVAGGFGPIANMNEVMIYRTEDDKRREALVFDVEKIRAGKVEDPPIRSDDVIVVQRDGARAVLRDSLFRDVIDSVNPFSILVPR